MGVQSDDSLCNLASEPTTKVGYAQNREVLITADAAVAVVASYTQQEMQSLMEHFYRVWKSFGLTVNLKKTKALARRTTGQTKLREST